MLYAIVLFLLQPKPYLKTDSTSINYQLSIINYQLSIINYQLLHSNIISTFEMPFGAFFVPVQAAGTAI